MEKRFNRPVRRDASPRKPLANLVIGLRPVAELLKSDKEIDRLIMSRELLQRQEGQDLMAVCKLREIPCQVVPAEKLVRITPKMHQGVVAFISPVTYQKIENIVPILFEEGKTPFILVLDRITDVRNFGAIARTAECAGVDAIIVPEKGAAQIGEDAMKTSAGALNYIPICREKDLGRTIDFLVDSGLTVIACTEKGDESIFGLSLEGPVAVVMGSEEDGISEFILRKVHHLASLPQSGRISSLNVSVAAGVAMFEIVRQRFNLAKG